MDLKKSIELYKKALTLMPGGVNSPVRAFKSVGGNPIFMKSGKGSKLTDVDGNEYIDYCMSWGPMILGHGDEDVIAAVIDAAQRGTSFGTPNAAEVEIAKMVVDRFKSIEKVRFVNSGTEATMSAIRLARGYTGRDRIIKFDGCYHGHADHLLVAGGSGLATFGTPDSAGVTRDNARDTVVVPFNDIDSLRQIVSKEKGNIAAVILEPLPCNYGMIPPKGNYLNEVRWLCDEEGILLIFDEVITGFRLARGGAQEYYNVQADITTLGKVIGGGLPVGAYGASEKIMSSIAPDGPIYQAGTLSGNPLAMAAGIATLKKIDLVNAYGLLNSTAHYLRKGIDSVFQQYSGRLILLQCESIAAFYFTEQNEITSVDHVKQCHMDQFARFHGEMLKRGIYLSPSGYEVAFLSTRHTKQDIDKTIEAINDSLKAVFR